MHRTTEESAAGDCYKGSAQAGRSRSFVHRTTKASKGLHRAQGTGQLKNVKFKRIMVLERYSCLDLVGC